MEILPNLLSVCYVPCLGSSEMVCTCVAFILQRTEKAEANISDMKNKNETVIE